MRPVNVPANGDETIAVNMTQDTRVWLLRIFR
jgi:hypothetical protein